MALFSTLTALSQTPGSNPPDGATDAPSTIDDQLRYLGSFAALLRDDAHVYVSAVAGTNTITGTIASNPTSYTVGRAYRFVAAGANTGAVTLNFNAIGAKSLLKVGNVALTGGELQATAVYEVAYDGVNFQLVGMYGFKSSLGASGYQYLPTGLLLQWGTGTYPASGGSAASVTVSVPVTWTSGPYMVSVTPRGSANSAAGGVPTVSVASSTTSNINFTADTLGFTSFNQTVPFYWFALGK